MRKSIQRVLAVSLLILVPTVQAQDKAAYLPDIKAFFSEIDSSYPFFDLKGNREAWEKFKTESLPKAESCQSDSEFLGLVRNAIQALCDSHMRIVDAKAELPPLPRQFYSGISFMPAVDKRVVVMSAQPPLAETLKPGTVVLKIDGQNAREYLDKRSKDAWPKSFSSSPQRAAIYEYRIALRGEQGEAHTLTYLTEGKEKELNVTCDKEARGWPHVYNMPSDLTSVGKSLHYAQLPSGTGYVYLRHVDDSTADGLKKALESYPSAKGWIVDVRGNGGGGYDERLAEQLKAMPKPVAGILDAGCMSAGETFARDLVATTGAHLFGQKTAGASSAKRTWTFPSGIASVVIATRSRWRADGSPIEFNGIEPDTYVEPVPEEVAKGLNSEILRAEEWIGQQSTAKTK